jgi:hypothetical protein
VNIASTLARRIRKPAGRRISVPSRPARRQRSTSEPCSSSSASTDRRKLAPLRCARQPSEHAGSRRSRDASFRDRWRARRVLSRCQRALSSRRVRREPVPSVSRAGVARSSGRTLPMSSLMLCLTCCCRQSDPNRTRDARSPRGSQRRRPVAKRLSRGGMIVEAQESEMVSSIR